MNPLRSKPRVRKYAIRSPASHSTVVRTVVTPRVPKYRIRASPRALPTPWPCCAGSIPTILIHPTSWSSPKSHARTPPTRNPTSFPSASAARHAPCSPLARYAVRLPRSVVDRRAPMIAASISTARGASLSWRGRGGLADPEPRLREVLDRALRLVAVQDPLRVGLQDHGRGPPRGQAPHRRDVRRNRVLQQDGNVERFREGDRVRLPQPHRCRPLERLGRPLRLRGRRADLEPGLRGLLEYVR